MFCISGLLESWKGCFPKPASKFPTALETINTIVPKYQDALPVTEVCQSSEQPIRDVIEAETLFGISFFRGYHGIQIIDGQYSIVFSARFQRAPQKIRYISCPQVIRAHTLEPIDRELLRIKLDSVMDSVPWRKLQKCFNITRDNWLVLPEVEERFAR
jgi:hypothetical protein